MAAASVGIYLLFLDEKKQGGEIQPFGESLLAAIKPYLQSSKADALGLENIPTTIEAWSNLAKMLEREPVLTALMREFNPGARVTSVFRSSYDPDGPGPLQSVNASVGGVDTSKHARGLAIDYGGFGGDSAAAARFIAANASRLPPDVSFVYAEITPIHLHFEFFADDEPRSAIRFRREDSSGHAVPL